MGAIFSFGTGASYAHHELPPLQDTDIKAWVAAKNNVLHKMEQVLFSADLFGPRDYSPATLTLIYRGDDHRWPVYGIAVTRGCFSDTRPFEGQCAKTFHAHFIGAPEYGMTGRPRQAGSKFFTGIYEGHDRDPDMSVNSLIDALSPQWKIAELNQCTGALEKLRELDDFKLFDQAGALFSEDRKADIDYFLHADSVELIWNLNDSQASTTVFTSKDLFDWAVEFETLLRPCWKDNPHLPPWERAKDVFIHNFSEATP